MYYVVLFYDVGILTELLKPPPVSDTSVILPHSNATGHFYTLCLEVFHHMSFHFLVRFFYAAVSHGLFIFLQRYTF